MQSKLLNTIQSPPDGGFEMVRLSKSKSAVDISPNCLRLYHRNGLPFYKLGKAIFFSRSELVEFIKARGLVGSQRKAFDPKA